MPGRVLLVEDDELLGILFELALVDAGYLVTRAYKGWDALAHLAAGMAPPDLLITDIALGDGPDGWQLARSARAQAPQLPVIYMTDGRAEEWAPQHVPQGVLLLKPFPVGQLVEMVGHLLAASREDLRRRAC